MVSSRLLVLALLQTAWSCSPAPVEPSEDEPLEEDVQIDPSDYTKDCEADQDCVLVSFDVCFDCYDDAINIRDQERCNADRQAMRTEECPDDVDRGSCKRFVVSCDEGVCIAREE
jgi:hypothetical protein